MAEHHNTAPAELGAPMDYAEHERTYAGFTGLIKWASVVLAGLLIAMAFSCNPSVLICVAAWFIL